MENDVDKLKYIKYKLKYLNLKKQIGGNNGDKIPDDLPNIFYRCINFNQFLCLLYSNGLNSVNRGNWECTFEKVFNMPKTKTADIQEPGRWIMQGSTFNYNEGQYISFGTKFSELVNHVFCKNRLLMALNVKKFIDENKESAICEYYNGNMENLRIYKFYININFSSSSGSRKDSFRNYMPLQHVNTIDVYDTQPKLIMYDARNDDCLDKWVGSYTLKGNKEFMVESKARMSLSPAKQVGEIDVVCHRIPLSYVSICMNGIWLNVNEIRNYPLMNERIAKIITVTYEENFSRYFSDETTEGTPAGKKRKKEKVKKEVSKSESDGDRISLINELIKEHGFKTNDIIEIETFANMFNMGEYINMDTIAEYINIYKTPDKIHDVIHKMMEEIADKKINMVNSCPEISMIASSSGTDIGSSFGNP